MIYQLILWWATIFLRLYFRRTIVYGRDLIPAEGPLIVASNHPSAFLEASILATIMGRHIHFLVRGDMFNPKFNFLFRWTKQIPIYRQKDGIQNLRKNASSFDLTYRKLAEGEAVLIFPEAKTILQKTMRPIQRGTAHLAFGTMPLIKEEDDLAILPVGVNFTEPRYPGTDVVVQFGPSFLTADHSREDRDAIEAFTSELSDAMSPLIIQVTEGLEERYDVLVSVYFRLIYGQDRDGMAHEDLNVVASLINHLSNPSLEEKLDDHIDLLKKQKAFGLIYFPDLIIRNRLLLFIMFIFKTAWMLAGGWLWRGMRYLIFSKIKSTTFQSPVTVGVAMLLFPLVAIIFLIVCLWVYWPLWLVPAWLVVMASGALCRPPWHLIWKSLTMSSGLKSKLKSHILEFSQQIDERLKD